MTDKNNSVNETNHSQSEQNDMETIISDFYIMGLFFHLIYRKNFLFFKLFKGKPLEKALLEK